VNTRLKALHSARHIERYYEVRCGGKRVARLKRYHRRYDDKLRLTEERGPARWMLYSTLQVEKGPYLRRGDALRALRMALETIR